jgi:hypothetical protein
MKNTMVPADVFDKAVALVAEYRAQHKSAQQPLPSKPATPNVNSGKGHQ